jgi:uncharacterized membrane protein
MMDLIYQPYFILLLVALIITVFYYFINIKNNRQEEEKENVKKPNYINLILAFLVAYLLLLIIYYGYKYFENSMPKLEKLRGGGASDKPKISQEAKEIFKERITIYGDDVDISILEN